jgi:hypothetical protein
VWNDIFVVDAVFNTFTTSLQQLISVDSLLLYLLSNSTPTSSGLFAMGMRIRDLKK